MTQRVREIRSDRGTSGDRLRRRPKPPLASTPRRVHSRTAPSTAGSCVRCYPAGMSKMLSGAEVGAREAESERGEKTPLANAKNCRKTFDTLASSTKNCTFLTLVIPGNFAPLMSGNPTPADQFSAALWQEKRPAPKVQIPQNSHSPSHKSHAVRAWLQRPNRDLETVVTACHPDRSVLSDVLRRSAKWRDLHSNFFRAQRHARKLLRRRRADASRRESA